MKVLLDTTYLLPLAGIAVERVEQDVLKRARDAGHQVFISEISLFELLAKAAKLSMEHHLDDGEDRASLAVQSILQDQRITRVSPYEEPVARKAIELRRHHADFVDCIILASALETCEALVSEDAMLSKNDPILRVTRQTNPGFRIITSSKLLRA